MNFNVYVYDLKYNYIYINLYLFKDQKEFSYSRTLVSGLDIKKNIYNIDSLYEKINYKLIEIKSRYFKTNILKFYFRNQQGFNKINFYGANITIIANIY
jgi:hypothetical protein